MKKLNLDALDTVRRTVTRAGVDYIVKPITPRVVYIVDDAEGKEGVEKIRAYVSAVEKLVPGMPDVDELSMAQLRAIVELASQQANAVEEAAADPNAGSPVEQPVPVAT